MTMPWAIPLLTEKRVGDSQCGQRVLSLDTPQIMGVLNVTPDSFSDGGQLLSSEGLLHDRLLERAEQMVADGAAILDIGGESTRPGAAPVSSQEELDRVMGAVQLIAPDLMSFYRSIPARRRSCARQRRQAQVYSTMSERSRVKALWPRPWLRNCRFLDAHVDEPDRMQEQTEYVMSSPM